MKLSPVVAAEILNRNILTKAVFWMA